MSEDKKLRAPIGMNSKEFEAAVEMFYPELAQIVNDEINAAKKVYIVEYSDYNIDGFNKDYKEYKESTYGGGTWITSYNISGETRFINRIIEVSNYCESDYHERYTSVNLLNVLKHLSDNKEKHMYWFL